MARKRYQPEEIIQYLRTAEIEQAKGLTQEEFARKIGVTVTTLVRWKKEFGGLRVDQAKRLKDLEQENLRLKRIVANQAIDIDILKVAASGNF
jgi:transcriptional regulator with XRE-family HTH domain